MSPPIGTQRQPQVQHAAGVLRFDRSPWLRSKWVAGRHFTHRTLVTRVVQAKRSLVGFDPAGNVREMGFQRGEPALRVQYDFCRAGYGSGNAQRNNNGTRNESHD
jgi:hypothetical protein